LVERDAELAAIAAVVDRAADGIGGVMLIEGPAGVGKTCLLQALERRASSCPIRVLRARGGELEQPFPFGIASQLLGRTVASLSAEQRAAVLSGAAGSALEVIEPRAGVEAADSPDARFARLHALYWLCVELAAEHPLLLVVDDAHWADELSSQWLVFMARRVGELPLTLALASRSEEWPAPLAFLAEERRVVRLRPRTLSEDAAQTLIERALDRAPDAEFTRACHRATGGNPFLLSELMATIRADALAPTKATATRIESLAPESITRSTLSRLARLPPEARALARAVAVLGAEAELRHAAACADLAVAAASAAADALVAAGLLDDARPLRLIHPLVRTAIYSDLPAGERAERHRRAADVLAQEDGDLDAIAAHLAATEAAGDRRTTELLLRASRRAYARGSPATAATYLRRALAEPPPPELRAAVLRLLGAVETRLGDPAAAEHVTQALRLTPERDDRAKLVLDVSIGYVVAGRLADATATLEHALAEMAEDDRELRWRTTAQLIGIARMQPNGAELAARLLERIPRDLRGGTPGERMILSELAWSALLEAEPIDRVIELATRAFRGGLLLTEQPGWSISVLDGIWALVFSEQHQPAMEAYDAMIARARQTGSPFLFALISSRRSQLHHLRGAIPDAVADARASVDAGRDFGVSLLVGGLHARLIDALLAAGDIEGAQDALVESGFTGPIPDIWQFLPLLMGRGRLRLARGETQAAIDDMLAVRRTLARFGAVNSAMARWASIAAVGLLQTGRRTEAQELIAGELAVARRFGAPGTVGVALRAAGIVEGGTAGIELLREAVAQLGRSPERLEHAHGLAELGAALRRAGARREAQEQLRLALDLADRCGGESVVAQARAELVITGARPRRRRLVGAASLTPSERRVAQLAAQGMTNRQIAQALFVSHPTVVTHLTHCYQKLDISSRDQLSDALGSDPS
jgi:DNA-binding CsgD family transcriptional regulator